MQKKQIRRRLWLGIGMMAFLVLLIWCLVPKTKPVIKPTIFMVGSGGDWRDLTPLVERIDRDAATPAKKGLSIKVMSDGSLKVSGKIDPDNDQPTILVGAIKGSNSGSKVAGWLDTVVDYLEQHYQVSSMNMVGFSSGGAGTWRYLLAHGSDSHKPPVDKWLVLAGQFNQSNPLSEGETLADVVDHGPINKSKYFSDYEADVVHLPKAMTAKFLVGDFDEEDSDGVVPWADTLGIMYLLRQQAIKEDYQIVTGQNTYHVDLAKNQQVQDAAIQFLYSG